VPRPHGIHAAGLAALALALAASGCGQDAPRQRTFGTLTDCAAIGPVATSTDPPGDQRDGRGRRAAKPLDQGDLLGLRIARRGGRLCAEFRVAGAVASATAFVLALRPQDRDAPLVRLQTTVLGGEDPKTFLSVRAGAKLVRIPATVGIHGDRLTVVVDRAPFAAAGLGRLFDAFRFQARAAAVDRDDHTLSDCLPACS
jgi:hypothetical protein